MLSITENSLWQVLIDLIAKGLCQEQDGRGKPNPFYVPGLALRRAYQPTTQARTGGPELLLHRASSRRYGAQGTRQEWEPGSETMYEYTEWLKEDSFQATAVAATDPADESAATEKDMLELFGAYMQSPAAVMPLAAAGIGILRVTDVQETPYQDEHGHHRMSVYIVFTVSYPQFIRREIPVATSIEHKVFRV